MGAAALVLAAPALSYPNPSPEVLRFHVYRGSNAQAVSWHGQQRRRQCAAAWAVLASPQGGLQVSVHRRQPSPVALAAQGASKGSSAANLTQDVLRRPHCAKLAADFVSRATDGLPFV